MYSKHVSKSEFAAHVDDFLRQVKVEDEVVFITDLSKTILEIRTLKNVSSSVEKDASDASSMPLKDAVQKFDASTDRLIPD